MSSTVHSKVAPAEPMHRSSLPVLRTVASFELAKGLIVLLAACGVLLLIRREDPWDIADSLLKLLHISPDHHVAQVFLDWADSLTAARIWTSRKPERHIPFCDSWKPTDSGTPEPGRVDRSDLRRDLPSVRNLQSDSPAVPFPSIVLLINVAIVLYMVYELKTGKPSSYPRIDLIVASRLAVPHAGTFCNFCEIQTVYT